MALRLGERGGDRGGDPHALGDRWRLEWCPFTPDADDSPACCCFWEPLAGLLAWEPATNTSADAALRSAPPPPPLSGEPCLFAVALESRRTPSCGAVRDGTTTSWPRNTGAGPSAWNSVASTSLLPADARRAAALLAAATLRGCCLWRRRLPVLDRDADAGRWRRRRLRRCCVGTREGSCACRGSLATAGGGA